MRGRPGGSLHMMCRSRSRKSRATACGAGGVGRGSLRWKHHARWTGDHGVVRISDIVENKRHQKDWAQRG